MNYIPLKSNLLLRSKRTDERSEGGIIIPEQARDTLNEGEIVARGPDVCSDKLKPGAVVVFSKHSDWKVEIDGETFILVAEENVLLLKVLSPLTQMDKDILHDENQQVTEYPVGVEE